MAQLKDLIVNGASIFLDSVYVQTPSAGTNDDEIATTAFVKTAIQNALN